MVATKKVVLTDRSLKALKPAPAGKRRIVWDGQQPHFGVRVTDRADAKGKATSVSFIVVRRRPGEPYPDTVVLGKYPATKLKDARAAVPGILGIISEGKSPREAENEKRREAARKRRDTFASAVTGFLEDDGLAGLRSGRETESLLRREFLGQVSKRLKRETDSGVEWVTEWSEGPDPIWRDTPVADIARRDVIERLDSIKRRGGKFAARHALGAARKFFGWCAEGERFGIEVSPCANVRDKTIGFGKDGRELKRRRVLADAELRDVWAAADHLTAKQREKALAKNRDANVDHLFDPAEPLVKLLALTGQRLRDIADAKWGEIDIDKATLTIPPERYKTNTAQVVPLAPAALKIVKALPRFGKGQGYILTTMAGARPVSGFAKIKSRLDTAIVERRTKDDREAMPAWTLHDLRRTLRTRLTSDLGVDAFIAERCLGHALPGLHGVYDQGTHAVQKRDALERWAEALAVIVGTAPPPKDAAVVPQAELERRRKGRRRA